MLGPWLWTHESLPWPGLKHGGHQLSAVHTHVRNGFCIIRVSRAIKSHFSSFRSVSNWVLFPFPRMCCIIWKGDRAFRAQSVGALLFIIRGDWLSEVSTGGPSLNKTSSHVLRCCNRLPDRLRNGKSLKYQLQLFIFIELQIERPQCNLI